MNKVKVKYVKDRVEITMPLTQYSDVLQHFNVLNEAINDYQETLDFKISHINGIDDLKYALIHSLGFKRIHDSYYSRYRAPTKGGK
jgi:hypothetical protein